MEFIVVSCSNMVIILYYTIGFIVTKIVKDTYLCTEIIVCHTFFDVSTVKEVMPMVDAVEEMLGITFIRSKIVGNAEKRGLFLR